jgi:myosin-crossreactive antigen
MIHRFKIYYNIINPVYAVYQVKSYYFKKKAIQEFIKLHKIKEQDLELLDIRKITEKEYLEENIWQDYKRRKK